MESLRLNRLLILLSGLQLAVIAFGLFWLRPVEIRHEIDHGLAQDCLMIAGADNRAETVTRSERLPEHVRTRFALFSPEWQRIAGTAKVPPADRLRAMRPGAIQETDVGDTAVRGLVCSMPGGDRLFVGRELSFARFGDAGLYALVVGLALTTLLILAAALASVRRTERRYEQVGRFARKVVAENLEERLEIEPGSGGFGRLCMQINQMLDRIHLLVEELRHIGDDISHELRTPLTRMRARLERMCDDPAMAHASDECGQVMDQVDRSLRIVDAIMRLRQISREDKRSAFQEIDLARLIGDLAALYEPVFEDRGMRLETRIDQGFSLMGDADLLNEALANLLENALKHARSGEIVTLGLSRDERSPVVWVEDGGAGIEASDAVRIFDRFDRGGVKPASNGPASGQGLGLPIARAIANLHGLELAAEPGENGAGSRFTMRRLTGVERSATTPAARNMK